MTKLARPIWGNGDAVNKKISKSLYDSLRTAKLGRVEVNLTRYEGKFFIRYAIKDSDRIGLTARGKEVLDYDLDGNIKDDGSDSESD